MQQTQSYSLLDLRDRMVTEGAMESKPTENRDLLDMKGRIYATGKRKTSVARVWLTPGGKGKFVVNNRSNEVYFQRETLCSMVLFPFHKVGRAGQYDVWCTVAGGGLSGQAGAVRHGISKALQLFEPALRPPLKAEGLLTRDSRRVERKKPGFRKARRRPQFSKR